MSRRALVLGSGGFTGVAWEAGVLQGLHESGVRLDRWDLVVGTSAGSFVGAHLLADGTPTPLYEAQLATDVQAAEAALGAAVGGLVMRLVRLSRDPRRAALVRLGTVALILRAAFVDAARHGLGELRKVPVVARSRRPGAVQTPEDLAAVGSIGRGVRTPERVWVDFWSTALAGADAWPTSPLHAIALDIADGSRRAIDRDSGVPVARAVAASTAVPGVLPLITIGGHRYMDGGGSTQTHADLATGYDEVIVVAPTDRGPLAGELEALRATGVTVHAVQPGPASLAALGDELARMDPARIAASTRAGREDGLAAGRRIVAEV